MDQHHPSRRRPLKQWAEGDAGGGASVPAVAPATSRRSAAREERHPNSVTAPPIHRGSMPPRPWRGFWNSLGTAGLASLNGLLGGQSSAAPARHPASWERAAKQRRAVFALITLVSATLA